MKFQLLLLDANVVIYLHELGLWKQFTEQCKVTLAETVRQEADYWVDHLGQTHQINLEPDIQTKRIQCISLSLDKIEKFKQTLGLKYLDKMDPGETESLAFLMESHESWLLSSGDEIVYKTLGRFNRAEQGISLQEILEKIGLSRPNLSVQYTKQFRLNVTQKGKIDSITGFE
jgi:hypothetical protein